MYSLTTGSKWIKHALLDEAERCWLREIELYPWDNFLSLCLENTGKETLVEETEPLHSKYLKNNIQDIQINWFDVKMLDANLCWGFKLRFWPFSVVIEDLTRMGTTWQFPVWIIMLCFLSVSHALSISMIIIFTLQPTVKYKWWYLLLNSCNIPPQQWLWSREHQLVGPGGWGFPGPRWDQCCPFSVIWFGNTSGWKA